MNRQIGKMAVLIAILGLFVGCVESPEPSSISSESDSFPEVTSETTEREDTNSADRFDSSTKTRRQETPNNTSPVEKTLSDKTRTEKFQHVQNTSSRRPQNFRRLPIDDAKAKAAGLRKLTGKRLTLYTDLPSSKEVDILPKAFDQAFPQWCKYFDIDPAKHPDWHMTGSIMKEKAPFREVGLLPANLPPFGYGYARDYDLWLNEQPSDYYRRHLLLHEGTHGFMNTVLGGCGPPWYMEGTAELLSTHRWQDEHVTLNSIPANREEVPMWGRIKLVRESIESGRGKRLIEVIEYGPRAHLKVEPYAWCWATAIFLDRHPRYSDRFRQLSQSVLKPNLSERFQRSIGDEWDALNDEWDAHVAGLEFGHDVRRMAIDFDTAGPIPNDGAIVSVDATQGWQNSGYRCQAETSYEIRASGRYQVANQPKIWWCEPGGVSIRYYHGRPLGILLAAVRADEPKAEDPCAFLHPIVIGLGTRWTSKHGGTLFFRINDSAGELDDNAGSLSVSIRPSSS